MKNVLALMIFSVFLMNPSCGNNDKNDKKKPATAPPAQTAPNNRSDADLTGTKLSCYIPAADGAGSLCFEVEAEGAVASDCTEQGGQPGTGCPSENVLSSCPADGGEDTVYFYNDWPFDPCENE